MPMRRIETFRQFQRVVTREVGAPAVTLDTNSKLTAAGRLYASRGYVQVPDFNGEPHADRWYRKELSTASGH
jgi:hypothetical protein